MKLIHAGFSCTSVEHASQFFEDLLGLEYSREYTVPSDLMEQLFGISRQCMVRLYELGTEKLEIFIAPWLKRPSPIASPPRSEEEVRVEREDEVKAAAEEEEEEEGDRKDEVNVGKENRDDEENLMNLVKVNGEYTGPQVSHLCIQVEDREALIRRSMDYGFRVYEKEREGKPNLVFIYDHDGNPFEIIQ